jgi:hypothetical protein
MVSSKEIRIEPGVDLDHTYRIMEIFQGEAERRRQRGIHITIGTETDCMLLFVRETKTNVLVRIAAIVQGGRYVSQWGKPVQGREGGS